ncbi:MAG TPA: GTP-binding protein, partial [Microlunatus sp.]|nr:GTP-binding protein [Microlunatus sp.]
IRSRGHFWLPTRPDEICEWDGAGGQLSVGAYGFWGSRPPSTHLRYVGIDAADRDRIAEAFAQTVLTPVELRRPDGWVGRDGGFEPWLGTRHSAA